MATQAEIAQVQKLYVGYLGRAADKAGQDFWVNAIAAGTATLDSIATGLTLSTEYTAQYDGLSDADFVEKVYTNVLGRASDAEGKAFWVAALANGTATHDNFVNSLTNSLGTQDQATINNKVYVAQTYTDTVGADYNATAGANIIAGVTNDPATVSDAIAQIGQGSLPGQVVGLTLVNTLTTAQAAQTSYETTNKAALDTLAEKLGVTVGTNFNTELTATVTAANAARTAVSADSTNVLSAQVTDATQTLATAKATVTAQTNGAAAITAYDSAVATDKAAAAALDANTTATAAAEAGLNSAVTTTGSAVTYATLSTAAGVTTAFTTAAQVTDFLADPASGTAARAALVTELNKVTTYGAEVVKAGDLGLAAANADAALTTATTNLNAISGGSAYISAEGNLATAQETLADAQAADADVAAAKAIVTAHDAVVKATTDAGTAITEYNSSHTDTQIKVLATTSASDEVKETFYFQSKAVAANDFTIGTATATTHFGSGDSIVLGSDVSYNSGALTTGDNNKLEFFLVQKGNDTLVIVETAAFGSSTTTHTATGDATAVASPDAAVITLTGVSVADLTVNNGVISHVA